MSARQESGRSIRYGREQFPPQILFSSFDDYSFSHESDVSSYRSRSHSSTTFNIASIESNDDSIYLRKPLLAGEFSGVARKLTQSSTTFKPIETVTTSAIPESISANWQDIVDSSLPMKTFELLVKLARKKPDWNGNGSLPLNAYSLASFLRFWKKVREIAVEPDLVLTSKGNLQAEWFKDRLHFLEIDFREEGQSSFFGLFDGRKAILEGASSLETVLGICLSHKGGIALRWS